MSDCPSCTCPTCGTCNCYHQTEQPTPAQIQADIDWAFAQTAADVARLRARDSLPLAGWMA